MLALFLKVILKFFVALQFRECLVHCNRVEDRSRNDGRNHSPESVWFVLMGMFGGGQWSDTDGGYIITLPPSLRTEESSLLFYFTFSNILQSTLYGHDENV